MIKKFSALAAGLVLVNFAFAAEKLDSAVISDAEPAVLVASTKSDWSLAAKANTSGVVKVREFHDMGKSGVQQIDYVVNCNNQTMALAGFAVLTPNGRLPSNFKEAAMNELSFYKPLIEHDQKIANNNCDSRMALNQASRAE